MKRICSVLIALVLFITLLAVPTSAAEAQSPAIAYVSGTAGEWGGPENTLDGNSFTKWCLMNMGESVEVVFKTEEAVSIVGYSISNANDNANNPGRTASAWNVYGSTDGTTWNIIHKVENDTVITDENYKTFYFALDSAAPAYQYYKYEVTAMESNVYQISEIAIYTGAMPEVIECSFVDGTPSPYNCPPSQLIDGTVSSKWCLPVDGAVFVSFSVPEAMSIKGYTLINGEDNEANPGRTPDDWNLYGSNDGETWNLLHAVEDDETMEDVNFAEYHFYLDAASEAYKYFKLEVLSSDNDNACLQISELVLIGAKGDPDADTNSGSTSPDSSTSPDTSDYVAIAIAAVVSALAGVVIIEKKKINF